MINTKFKIAFASGGRKAEYIRVKHARVFNSLRVFHGVMRFIVWLSLMPYPGDIFLYVYFIINSVLKVY